MEVAAPHLPSMFTPALIGKVQRLIDEGEKTGERIATWEKIQTILLENDLAQENVQMAPEYVGVHEGNRSKFGVGGSESQHHGAEVLTSGWSFKKAADATAFEVPPAPFDEPQAIFNVELQMQSQGLIPPLIMLKLLSVGGSHTNTFCRQVKAGVRSIVPKLTSSDGIHLNAEELLVKRPGFKEAVEKGMKWFTIHWGCMFAFPKLASLIQSAMNTEARGKQHEVEMMAYLHQQRMLALSSGQEPDWEAIVMRAKSSLPPCAPYMHTLAEYVKQNAGGGADGENIVDLLKFMRAFACTKDGPSRVLGGEYIAKVTSLQWGPSENFPRMRNACLEANLASPKVQDGICRLLSVGNLAALTAKVNIPVVKEAERLLASSGELCSSLKVAQDQRVLHLGKLACRCVCFVCKKGKELENRQFNSIAEIAEVSQRKPKSERDRVGEGKSERESNKTQHQRGRKCE